MSVMISRVWLFAGLAALPLAAKDVTFNRDVAPPMSLMSYKEAKPWAAAIKEAVLLRKMPPWGADPHFGSWSNDARLSDGEIATLKAWAEGTCEEGASTVDRGRTAAGEPEDRASCARLRRVG